VKGLVQHVAVCTRPLSGVGFVIAGLALLAGIPLVWLFPEDRRVGARSPALLPLLLLIPADAFVTFAWLGVVAAVPLLGVALIGQLRQKVESWRRAPGRPAERLPCSACRGEEARVG
jgi:hypothetical protein